MADAYTTRLRLLKPEQYSRENSWGPDVAAGVLDMADEGWGVEEVTVSGDVTLTSNNALTDQSRNAVLILSGDGGYAVTTPAVDKPYLIVNGCTADVTVKPSGGTAATVRAGTKVWYWTNAAATVGYVADPTLDEIKTAAANVALGGYKLTGVGTATSTNDAATLANKIHEFTAPTAALAMNSQKITGLADPDNDQDAATRAYVISQTATSVAAAAASASAASDSETAAAASETAASNAQSYAEEWANKAEDSAVSVAAGGDASTTFSALHWAAKAADSASGIIPLPDQTGNSGKYLTTNGTSTSWATITDPTYSTVSPYSAISGATSAAAFTRYLVDTSGGGVTLTLPASPTAGDWIEAIRSGGSDVTIGRNGNTIAGSAADLTLDVDGYGALLLYTSAGWIVSGRNWAA